MLNAFQEHKRCNRLVIGISFQKLIGDRFGVGDHFAVAIISGAVQIILSFSRSLYNP